ncbi:MULTISPECIES: hypothetical protein [unclassified Streptomyces]|uniref:hypothetical protein n=1 Tax=unclassified Streptomyces TaxID=2593676 RepID=UPI00148881CF|nr:MULTISPECIES: hypothetical protein [unclassified Streptomyces]
MAQLVKLEAGDVLVLANVGDTAAEDLEYPLSWLRERLGLAEVVVFAGDVDLSKLPPRDAS